METQKYQIRNLTPEENMCACVTCPAIYDLTPKENMCVSCACPSISDYGGFYLIVGEQVNPKDVGLEKKVGEGEEAIMVDKGLIDNKKPSP